MELSDVVNAHYIQYAFPVVGIVLCAVLVFAFGFQSPAQPPSFDAFEEDERKGKKLRSKKLTHHEKKHGSGVNSDDVAVAGSKPPTTGTPPPRLTSVSANNGNNGRNFTGKTHGNEAINPTSKLQQSSPVKSNVKPGEGSNDATDEKAVGDWMTAVSKKERKSRGRRDGSSKTENSVSAVDNSPKSLSPKSSGPMVADTNVSQKKVPEMPKVTVTVPAMTSGNSVTPSSTTTTTTVTNNAVIKVKVVPAASVTTNSGPARNVDKPTSEPSPTHATDTLKQNDSWSEVKTTKSPKKKGKTTSESPKKEDSAISNSGRSEVKSGDRATAEVRDLNVDVNTTSVTSTQTTSRQTSPTKKSTASTHQHTGYEIVGSPTVVPKVNVEHLHVKSSTATTTVAVSTAAVECNGSMSASANTAATDDAENNSETVTTLDDWCQAVSTKRRKKLRKDN